MMLCASTVRETFNSNPRAVTAWMLRANMSLIKLNVDRGRTTMIAHGIDLNSEAIRDFCRRWKIRELSVFGSILRDDFRPHSDSDFLLDHDDDAEWDMFDHFDMEDELAGILARNVDLVDRSA